MDERMQFIADYLRDEESVTELCRAYAISRKTGYKWIARYEAAGWGGVREHARTPHTSPRATPEAVQAQVIQLRSQYPTWGPRKLVHRLARVHPTVSWPAASTAGAILKRAGLVPARRRRVRTPPSAGLLGRGREPNEIWATDFKGWFRTGDRQRVDPLTVSDLASRYLLRCEGLTATTCQAVQPVFLGAFHEFGLPAVIRTDNGPPFASGGLGGLSRLAVWWIRLGIRPERIAPGHPEQNGRHERLHRTLKAATASPPQRTRRQQQQVFDHFRREYNEERPHEALAMRPPAHSYTASPRALPARLPEMEYPAEYEVRRVRSNGEIRWHGKRLFVSEALIGEPVGLLPVATDVWRLEFGPVPLALYHAGTDHLVRL